MPAIPIYEQETRTPGNVPNTAVNRAPNIIDPVSSALRFAGETMEADLNKVNASRDQQDLIDYNSKLNDLHTKLWLGDPDDPKAPGAANAEGRNAEGLTARTMKEWKAQADAMMPKFRTAEAKMRAQGMLSSSTNDLQSRATEREMAQGKVAEAQTYKSGIDNLESTAIANADDPVMLGKALAQTETLATDYNTKHGIDPAVTANSIADQKSRIVKGVLAAQLSEPDGTTRALETFKANKALLRGDDLVAVQNALKPQLLDVQATALSKSLVGGGWPAAAVGDDSVYKAFAHTESRGRQYGTDGGPLLGPANYTGERAVGQFQVMPSTGPDAAKMAGVAWDPKLFFHKKDGSDDDVRAVQYNAKLGQAYIDAQLKRFGGNLAVAAVAYNWGPERAAKWAANGMDMSKLPPETQKYVASVTGQMGGAPIAMDAPTTPDAVTRIEGAALQRADQIGDLDLRRANREKISQWAQEQRQMLAQDDQAKSDAKRQFANNVEDINATLLSGGNVPIKDRPPVEQYKAVFGDDEGQRRFDATNRAAMLGPDVKALATASQDEATAIIAKHDPGKGGIFEAADRQKDSAQLVEVYSRIRSARESDPVAYVAQTSKVVALSAQGVESVRKAYEANPTPALGTALRNAGTAYALTLESEQRRQGVPEAKIALLSKGQVEAIKGDVEARLAKGDIPGAMQTIATTKLAFGDRAGDIVPQLGQNAGVLTTAILEGLDPRTVATLGNAMATSDDDRKKAIGSKAAGVIDDGVRAALGNLMSTDANDYPRMAEMTRKIAQQLAMNGMDSGQAAAQAASQTINGRYVWGTTGGAVTYRVPLADVEGRPIDTDRVMRGANGALARLQPAELGIDDHMPPGVDANLYRVALLNQIRTTGRWLNTGNESGLRLTYRNDRGEDRTVRDAKGRAIVRTWAELAAEQGERAQSDSSVARFGYLPESP